MRSCHGSGCPETMGSRLSDQECECHEQRVSAASRAELLGGDAPQAHCAVAPSFLLTPPLHLSVTLLELREPEEKR